MTDKLGLPLPQMSRYAGIPPEQFQPDAVKPIVAKLYELRTRRIDAREKASEAKANIDRVDHAETVKAANAIANGDFNAKPNHEAVDKARAEFEALTRELHATDKAHDLTEAELDEAYRANADETIALATDTVEAIRPRYREAIEALAAIRREYHTAVEALSFARAVTVSPQERNRHPMVAFNGQRVGDSGQATMMGMRAECDPPMRPETFTTDDNYTRQTSKRVPL